MKQCQKTLTAFLLLGFVSLSVFGFLGMLETADMAHGANTCLASLAQNGACPPPEHTLASAIFHTNALKVFSTTLLTGLTLIALWLFAGFAAPFMVSPLLGIRTEAQKINEAISRYLALRRLKFALARLEHSPTK